MAKARANQISIGRARRLLPRAALGLLVTAAFAGFSSQPSAASAVAQCDLYAATSGDDAASGNSAAPFRTVQRLVDRLQPGQTGCLLAGTFTGDVRVARGGLPGSPLTLTSALGAAATVAGRLYVTDTANDVVISNLYLDGRNADGLPSPTVNGDRVTFTNDDVTNYNTGICFVLGSTERWGVAVDVVIQNSRIHNCGKLPATNHEHGIYVEATRNALIQNNAIYDNADRGVQLYPDAQGTVVQDNVIDGNGVGVIFSGDSVRASSNNVVSNNIVTNSAIRRNIESWWGGPVGSGNVARRNCLWNGRLGAVGDPVGFVATDSVVADPGFVDRSAKDYSVPPSSPCAGMGLRSSEVGVTTAPLPIPQSSDFTLDAIRSKQTIERGETGAFPLSVTRTGGFAGSVQLSVAGLPKNATGTFDSNPSTSPSTLTVAAGRKTPRGRYTLTITGASDGLVHQTTVTLVVK